MCTTYRTLIVLSVLLAGCGERSRDIGHRYREHAPPGIVVDSALPMDTLLQRFQTGLERPDALSDASASRESLTRRYLDAIARADTLELRRMHITRAEYAFLYFPRSMMMHAPYDLPPDVAWLLLSAESAKGVTSVLRRFGGQRLELRGVHCARQPLREGPNVVWRNCVVHYRGEDHTEHERPLFAAIIERGGHFKFLSYATTL